ncbi:hypothetical protein BD410DRAFT_786669 [Rickenella mellea]|uniref:Efficient mitochondria targeting-associated protein 19 n=1 Tax=Rickenella mellea TaxID=50990 RepID=A0A4Y7QAY3_9AGAM|nr:hypothetical protein BD410DRAFT_786669 [Rickenella mellea]
MSRSWSARPLDLLYFIFFCVHIPATLMIDLQGLLPSYVFPAPVRKIVPFYLSISNDPLMAGAFGMNGLPSQWLWFKSFLFLECLFQLPTFLVGIYALWHDMRKVYPLLLTYGASTFTTLVPVLTVFLTTPVSSTPQKGIHTITPSQLVILLASYIPFTIVPLLMTVDMAIRLAKNTGNAENARQVKKRE